MSYRLLHEIPSVSDYLRLRREAGLSAKSPEAAARGLPNSLFAVQVLQGDEVVGMGRVIGDGGCFFEVVDIAVLPSHQGQGLGRKIMGEITGYIEAHALPGSYVSLITNVPAFYEPYGFALTAPDDAMCRRFRVEQGA